MGKFSKCGKAFSQKQHLIDYFVTHTGRKDFVCDSCGRRLTRMNHLQSHKKRNVCKV